MVSFKDQKLGLSSDEWEAISPFIQKTVLAKGSFLFKEGNLSDDLYFLEKGCLDVIKGAELLSEVRAGEWIGELSAIVEDKPRPASLIAKTKSILMKISLSHLLDFSKRKPELYIKFLDAIAKDMADRLRLASIKALSTMKETVALDKLRIAMGWFLVNLLLAFATFFYMLKIIITLNLNPKVSTSVSIPIILYRKKLKNRQPKPQQA